jgi:hypothetical protein
MPAPKHRPRLSTDPRARMGVYKTIDDVPPKYQLSNHTARYDGNDVWATFLCEKTAIFESASTRKRYEKAGRYFSDFMIEQGRHHAIADPGHISAFLVALQDGTVGRHHHERTLQTVYFEYYQPLEAFYTWLMWHADHPSHVYHPVLMAVIEGGYAREVWDRKIAQNDKQ